MDKGQARCQIIVREVREESSQLARCQHTFIYDVLVRQRADVEVLVVYAVLYPLSQLVEYAVEDRHIAVFHSCYEDLLYIRLHATCADTGDIIVGGDIAQMHQRQSVALSLLNHYGENLALALLVLRQEDETCAVFSLLWHRYALQQNKFVRYLEQNTCSVASLVSCLCSAVLHVLKHFQGVIDKLVALVAMDIDNHSYATSIVFVGGVV